MNRFMRGSLMCGLSLMVTGAFAGCASPGASRAGADRGPRDEGSLKVGDTAPLFALKRLDDRSKTVRLASLTAKKPVVLFFGSYT